MYMSNAYRGLVWKKRNIYVKHAKALEGFEVLSTSYRYSLITRCTSTRP